MKGKRMRIIISGYDVGILDKTVERIMRKIEELKIISGGPFPLPTKRTNLTLLISPHKHKKSQEAFVREIHRRKIEIVNFTKEKLEELGSTEGIPQNVSFKLKDVPLKD